MTRDKIILGGYEQLEAIHINEQAEQHRAINLYEQGLRHY